MEQPELFGSNGEHEEFTIQNISDLQIALFEDNDPAIRRYVEHLDRETANHAFRNAGTYFHFPVVEIEGQIRASAGHIAAVFGYQSESGLRMLLSRRGIHGVKMGGFAHDVRIEIRKTLGLKDSDQKATLYDWPAFLIGGMNSTTNEAREVQTYLLKAERFARIGVLGSSEVRRRRQEYLEEPIHATAKVKLSDQAFKGNPIAVHILQVEYGIPAKKLLADSTAGGTSAPPA